MKVSLIAAVAANGAIGRDNDLIWHLPDDMKFFKETTRGHHVIMGRKNWESIPHNYRPLPGRPNIVVSRNSEYEVVDAELVQTIEAGLEIARKNGEDEAFVIGGGQIYRMALNKDLVDHMYITHVNHDFEADVFFPEFDASEWSEHEMDTHPIDERHKHSFRIVRYDRVR